MQERVLIVEDNNSIARKLSIGIGNKYGIAVDVVSSKADLALLLQESTSYLLALCDINIPDAPNGECVDVLLENKIPPVVMTASSDSQIRRDIIKKPIIDYVTKDHPEDIDYILDRVGEIYRNRSIKIMVVDDSTLARSIMVKLLRIQQFIVFEAANGEEALTIIEKHPDTKVVLTDYNMPVMDGLELTIALRQKFHRESLSIIAISSESDTSISSHLLKLGANDFIHKPFVKEEFDCRINNTVRALENLEKMLNLANRDYLTGLLNRRAFFKMSDEYIRDAVDKQQKFSVAMFDLDDFKQINDTYGHEAGDLVLKQFSSIVQNHIRGADIAARFGGEEFCVILKDVDGQDAHRIFDLIRRDVESSPVKTPTGKEIRFTTSIGMCNDMESDLTEMINVSDTRLYKAKLWGKNRICDDGK